MNLKGFIQEIREIKKEGDKYIHSAEELNQAPQQIINDILTEHQQWISDNQPQRGLRQSYYNRLEQLIDSVIKDI
jgi:predicted Zn-dependent peptidase